MQFSVPIVGALIGAAFCSSAASYSGFASPQLDLRRVEMRPSGSGALAALALTVALVLGDRRLLALFLQRLRLPCWAFSRAASWRAQSPLHFLFNMRALDHLCDRRDY
jgi:hypothetical protein